MSDTRGALLRQRTQLVAQVGAMQADLASMKAASEDSNADDEHDPEGATIAFERQQLAALLVQAQARLGEVDRALARLQGGSYGVCERCGRPIGAERLEARPSARTCIACARATG